MTTEPNAGQPIPEGYHTVTPWISSRDTARLLDFVKQAFGAEELARVSVENGAIGHAEFKIGDSIVMAFDAKEEWPDTPCFLRLYVADGDAVYQQALSAGATSVTEMTSMFWGDRVGRVRDPLGNVWWIQTRLENLDQEEMKKRSQEKKYIDAMQYVQQSAQLFLPEALRSKNPRR
jgi:PhnB protein